MAVQDGALLNDRSAFTPVLWRVSDFTLNLTLPQLIQYDIESPETLRFTTPPSSVLSDQPIVMPEIKIFPISGRVDVNGTLLDGVDENLMNGRGDGEYLTLIITLTNETWVEELGQGPNAATRAFAQGLTADSANTNTCQEYDGVGYCVKGGWMDVIQPILMGPTGYFFIQRDSDTVVRVLIPYEFGPGVDYDIFAPDLINIYIPPQAVFSDQLLLRQRRSASMHTRRAQHGRRHFTCRPAGVDLAGSGY